MSDGLDELYQVSQAVLSVARQMPVRDVLQVIVRSARSLVGARYAALGVPDEGDSFAEFTPPDLDAGGLAESLRRYAVLAGRAHGIPVTFTAAEHASEALKPRQEAALYRVAQEALHNALRHSGASTVGVRLTRTGRQVTLDVTDDGHGFVAEAPSGGVGLASMRERAAAAGGTLVIKSRTKGEKGTLVRMTVEGTGGHR